jgi:cytochrome b6-f complex iron-sulfur subunit
MERKEFLGKIGGSIAVTCVACMMSACSKEETTPGGTTGPITPTPAVILAVNLSTQLLNVNDFVSDKGVIVVRTAAGNAAASFSAFSNVCPHQNNPVTFNKTTGSFSCATHGSAFSITGAVTKGPATTAMGKLTVEISGTTLNVK